MKRFYSEKETKRMVANAATTAAITAKNEGNKKAQTFGGLGVLIGAAITVTCSRSYCKKIETTAAESCVALKKDINILRAGLEEVDKTFDKLPAGTINLAEMPAFVEARKLITEKGGMTPPAPKEEDKKKKEDNKKKENNKKKGGDK